MKKAIAKGTVGAAVVLAVVCLTTLVLAEDFGSIAGGADFSGGGGAPQESAGPISFQPAGKALESTAGIEQAQANTGEEKLQIMSANEPLMDEFGHLNPNMHSGDTGYYNGFPVTYTKEPGKDHTFVVSYSINGWQNADGTPFTSTFTQTTNPDRAVSQVKGFIDQRTDPSKNIQPWDLDVDKNFNLVPNSSFWASHSTEKYLGFQIITCSDDLGDRSSWGSGYGYYVPLISNGNKQEIRQMAHLGTSMQFLLFEGDMPDNKIKNEIYKTALIKPPVSSVK